MPDPTTTNKGLDLPITGEYVNAWGPVINTNFIDIDAALGGTTSITVTSVATGTYTLTLAQYQPLNIEWNGVLSGNLNYQIPAGIGGIWALSNTTTGAFTLQFSIASGNALTLASGRTLVTSDGVNVSLASTNLPPISFSQISGTIANPQVPQSAVTQYQNAMHIDGSQIVSGIVPDAHLPNPGVGPGVVIQADPGTTPSGAPGEFFLYY